MVRLEVPALGECLEFISAVPDMDLRTHADAVPHPPHVHRSKSCAAVIGGWREPDA